MTISMLRGIFIILVFSLLGSSFQQHLEFNRMTQRSMVAILSNPGLLPQMEADWVAFGVANCRANWFRGLIAGELHEEDAKERSWRAALRCAPDFVPMLRAVAPNDQSLAELAVQEYPGFAETWFWLADLSTEEIPEDAISLYYRGLLLEPANRWRWQQLSDLFIHLDSQTAKDTYVNLGLVNLISAEQYGSVDARFLWARIIGQESPEAGAAQYYELLLLRPHDGVYWRELGDLLREHDPNAAIEAYLQSCRNGDPGSNGCYRAGLTAESQGDYENAIQYYRYSKWEGALKRAVELEAQLETQE